MRKLTADNMIKALQPYKQYLLINEWENIKNVILHWVEDEKTTIKEQHRRDHAEPEEEPPLKALWNYLWEKKIPMPIATLILIFGAGLAIGIWGF